MNIHRAVDQLRLRVERLLSSPTEELGRGGQFLAYQARLGWFCGRKLVKDRLQITASALSYKTLLSLIPVLILFWLFVNAVVPETEVRQGVRQSAFRLLNLETIQVNAATEDEAALGLADMDDGGATEIDLIVDGWHRAFQVQQRSVFEKDHGVGAPQSLFHESLGVVGCGRDRDAQPGKLREQRVVIP